MNAPEVLKDKIAKLIVMENLPFTFVESKYFIETLTFANESADVSEIPMADAMADHITSKFRITEQNYY